jgi:hypothetical protein
VAGINGALHARIGYVLIVDMANLVTEGVGEGVTRPARA